MEQAASSPGYAAARGFLLGRINYEHAPPSAAARSDLKLDRMRRLLARLGSPEKSLPAVHIAGTKGKGSTAVMIASVLRCAGYRVGAYTSPHLERIEERFAVGGTPAAAADLLRLVEIVRPAVLEMDEAGDGPTFFEITTAMALLHFQRKKVELAVVEVGLGGRLDSTNVCRPLVSVITSISHDHTHLLGGTLRRIAAEKAGIIKPGVPVVSGVTHWSPARVIEETAGRQGSRLYRLGREFNRRFDDAAPLPGEGTSFQYSEQGGISLASLRSGLLGRHQADNAALAVAAVRRIAEAGYSAGEAAIREGLLAAFCPARIEVASRRPTVIVDAAHNVASVRALAATLDDSFSAGRRTLLFAASSDKKVAGMLRALLPSFQRVIFTRYVKNPRAVPPAELESIAQRLIGTGAAAPLLIQTAASPAEAWRCWETAAGDDELLCITGSFFLAAELRPLALSQFGDFDRQDAKIACST